MVGPVECDPYCRRMGRRMLRAVVSLLVALPLLMPPGVCVCRCAPVDRPSTALRTVARPACAHCCAHHKTKHQRAGTTLLTVPDGSQVPTHAPGCPALLTPDHAKVAQPVVVVDGPADSAVSLVHPF